MKDNTNIWRVAKWAVLAFSVGLGALFLSTNTSPASSIKEIAENSYKLYDGNSPICSSVNVGLGLKGKEDGTFLLTAIVRK